MKALQNIHINRDNAILVVVDVENEFCKPGGRLYNDTIAKNIPDILSSIQKLLTKARQAQVPIVYIQSMRTGDEAEFTVFKNRPMLKQGTWAAEICDEVKPQPGEIVVPKYSHDPFFRTSLDNELEKLVAEPTRHYAIVTGGSVNTCVYHAVMGFYLRHYWTVVPIDGVYYVSESDYKVAIEHSFSKSAAYPNIFLSRSDLIEVSDDPARLDHWPTPGC